MNTGTSTGCSVLLKCQTVDNSVALDSNVRVRVKILVLTFRAARTSSLYINELLHPNIPRRSLSSCACSWLCNLQGWECGSQTLRLSCWAWDLRTQNLAFGSFFDAQAFLLWSTLGYLSWKVLYKYKCYLLTLYTPVFHLPTYMLYLKSFLSTFPRAFQLPKR